MTTAEQLASALSIVRGSLVLVDLRGAVGREQMKTRPAIVVSANALNKALSTVIVVPVTTHDGKTLDAAYKAKPHEVEIPQGEGGIEERSMAEAQQVRTVDRFERIKKVIGIVSDAKMTEVSYQLFLALGGIGDGVT